MISNSHANNNHHANYQHASSKSQLSHYVDQAASGVEIIITRAGKPVACLVPLASKQTRQLGLGKGKFSMPMHLDTMHQSEIQQMFEDS